MRIVRAYLGAAVVTGCAAMFFVACGLSENGGDVDGLDSSTDVIAIDVHDAAPADNFVAPTCQTIDASCLGADIPAGWVLMTISGDAGNACPGSPADWEAHPYITNPVAAAGACSCGNCVVDGGYTCNGQVKLAGSTDNSCSDQDASITGGTAQCVTLTEFFGGNCFNNKASIAVQMPTPAGNPTCSAPSTGSNLASTTPELGCKPLQCTTDYCGMRAQGFQTCILHNNDPSGVCPAPFKNAFGTSALASAPGDYSLNCGACGCNMNAAGACTASLRVFQGVGGDTCDGDGSVQGLNYVETLDASATCQSTAICSYASMYFVPNEPPTPSCATTNLTGTSDASLDNPITICCAP